MTTINQKTMENKERTIKPYTHLMSKTGEGVAMGIFNTLVQKNIKGATEFKVAYKFKVNAVREMEGYSDEVKELAVSDITSATIKTIGDLLDAGRDSKKSQVRYARATNDIMGVDLTNLLEKNRIVAGEVEKPKSSGNILIDMMSDMLGLNDLSKEQLIKKAHNECDCDTCEDAECPAHPSNINKEEQK